MCSSNSGFSLVFHQHRHWTTVTGALKGFRAVQSSPNHNIGFSKNLLVTVFLKSRALVLKFVTLIAKPKFSIEIVHGKLSVPRGFPRIYRRLK